MIDIKEKLKNVRRTLDLCRGALSWESQQFHQLEEAQGLDYAFFNVSGLEQRTYNSTDDAIGCSPTFVAREARSAEVICAGKGLKGDFIIGVM